MRCVVTGAAGFIGSHLCELLLSQGDEVVGIDSFTDYYDPRRKEMNLPEALRATASGCAEETWSTAACGTCSTSADVVFHLAGQPGVRPSWGADFATYVSRNVLATQVLLEAARDADLTKLVLRLELQRLRQRRVLPGHRGPEAAADLALRRDQVAAEHLCELYRVGFGVPTVSLRLFTVYGPRQRPDMAFAKLVASALRGSVFELYGTGEQTRDFTFVGDVVHAMRSAADSEFTGVANIGGGSRLSMNQILSLVTELAGPPVLCGVRHNAGTCAIPRRTRRLRLVASVTSPR